jgi:O-succinylbenzoate synthase
MRLHLQFRRYALPFRAPVRTSHGTWGTREGILVQLKDESGKTGYGEAAPIPNFSRESVEADETCLRALGEWGEDTRLDEVPASLGCLRCALRAARQAVGGASAAPAAGRPDYLPLAALLPAGRSALVEVVAQGESGFRCFKWKVGVGDARDELALLDDLCAALPSGAKLRLDANGAWDRRRAEQWLERCAERPVEYVEQPVFAGAAATATERARADDLLRGLAEDYPTPIALDESLADDGDLERWLEGGWPGIFVLKPSLHGELDGALARLAKARAGVVFSSAIETGIGARSALEAAFAWPGETRALGFGVWPIFTDRRFDGPAVAPFIRYRDVERIDPEAVWNALN